MLARSGKRIGDERDEFFTAGREFRAISLACDETAGEQAVWHACGADGGHGGCGDRALAGRE